MLTITTATESAITMPMEKPSGIALFTTRVEALFTPLVSSAVTARFPLSADAGTVTVAEKAPAELAVVRVPLY